MGHLLVNFALLSMMAVGGTTSVLPDVHRLAVEDHRWMTNSEFAELFVLAQAAPGPNMMFVTLIGWKAAGLPGALLATLAMCGPSCVLTFFVSRSWHRVRHARWSMVVQAGLAPVTVGLLLASGYVLTRAADHTWWAYATTTSTVLMVLLTRINPLWMFLVAGLLGLAGVMR